MLSDMLKGREKISDELRKIIDDRTEPNLKNMLKD
jgi:hypothetical protein